MRRYLISIFLLAGGAGVARAQRGVDDQVFKPAVDSYGIFGTERARTSHQYDFGFLFYFDFAANPLHLKLGGRVPDRERFGFPYEAGWKAIGVLYADGVLDGTYDSNENQQITHWYSRGAWRCAAEPRYYVIAEDNQSQMFEPPRKKIANDYQLVADVTVQGRPKLHVYDSRADPTLAPVQFEAEQLGPRFDRELSLPLADPGTWASGPVPARYQRIGADFGDTLLLGAQLYTEDPRPGGVIRLDLFWLPRLDGPFRPAAVQLGRQPLIGEPRGTGCEQAPQQDAWHTGHPYAERLSIPIVDTAPPGAYPLLVGMTQSGRRGTAPAGSPATESIEIGQVEVRR